MTMHKIAIIRSRDTYSYDTDDYTKITESITEWDEVSSEDLTLLKRAATNIGGFEIIERITDQDFIPRTIKDYLQKAKKDEEKLIEKKRIAAEKKLLNAKKKAARDIDKKKKLLVKLKKELNEA